MKSIFVTIIGLLTILAGILPFIGNIIGAPEAITTGTGYSILVIIVGALGLIIASSNIDMSLMGPAKFFVGVIAVLTIAGGVLPLFMDNVAGVPTTGPIMSGAICVIGAIALFFGAKQF